MRNFIKVSLGAASLVTVVGVALADVPLQNLGAGNDFDNYTVDANGDVIYNAATEGSGTGTACPNNATCTVLDATGEGILQQRVEYDGDGTFFQTIIVDDGAASITDPSSQLEWRMENYVASGNPGPTADLATLLVVKSSTNPTDFDYMVTEFEGAEGNLVGADTTTGTGNQAAERIHQLNNNNGNRATEFFYEDNGPGGKRMGINMVNPDNEGQFTLRRVTGNYLTSGGTLALADGNQFTYGAGDNLQVVNIVQAASGVGPQESRYFTVTMAQKLTDNEGQTVGGVTFDNVIEQDSLDGEFGTSTGITDPLVAESPFTGIGSSTFLTPWDTSLFGAAPLGYVSNGSGGADGSLAATGSPTQGSGRTFWNAPPPWFQIVP